MIGRTDPSMFFFDFGDKVTTFLRIRAQWGQAPLRPVVRLCQLLLVLRRAGDGGDVAALTAITRDAAYKKIRHTFQFIYLH